MIPFDRIKPFCVAGHVYAGEYVAITFRLSGDLKRDLDDNSAWVAYWGYLTAEAKREHDEKEAAYRTARDTYILSRVAGTYQAPGAEKPKPKLAKTNAELAWRGETFYAEWTADVAEAERTWSICQFLYDAAQTRSHNLNKIAKLQLDEQFANRVTG